MPKEYTVTGIGESAFLNSASIISVSIPATMKTIGNNAFQNCTSLTSVVIPASVTKMGDRAFEGCRNLFNIYACMTTPFEISQKTFEDDTYFNANLFIPVGTMSKYKQTSYWSNFVWIEENENCGKQIAPYFNKNIIRQCSDKYGFDVLNIHCNDGKITSFKFSDKPELTFISGNNNDVILNISSQNSVIEYPYSNLSKITFTEDTIDYDPETAGTISISQTDDIMYIYDIHGTLVQSRAAGQTMELDKLPEGIYLVRTKSLTYKILKQ